MYRWSLQIITGVREFKFSGFIKYYIITSKISNNRSKTFPTGTFPSCVTLEILEVQPHHELVNMKTVEIYDLHVWVGGSVTKLSHL